MAKFLRRSTQVVAGTVTGAGWLVLVEFLAASQSVFQKGQHHAADQLVKLGGLMERCRPKEWFDTARHYGCSVTSEAANTAQQLKGTIGTEPTISGTVHDFLASKLPTGIVEPVTTHMQSLASYMHGRGVADIATKADLQDLHAMLAVRCGDVLTTGRVCGTSHKAMQPLLDQITTSGAATPSELACYLAAATLTLVVGAATFARFPSRNASAPAHPAPQLHTATAT